MLDLLLDARITSHMSDGMRAYTRELALRLPRLAPDLRIAEFAGGDNFDLSEQLAMPVKIARSRPRLVHFTTPFAPLLLPPRYAVTIHDLIDLHYPQFAKRKVQPYYRLVVRRLAAGAAAVLAPDLPTCDDLISLLDVKPERVRIVPLGVEESFGRDVEPLRGERPYFFYAGNHRPHKDLATLFAAWYELPEGTGVDLYVTGEDDFGGALRRYERSDGRIVCLGRVTRERLAAAMRGAVAYVHPALIEGFGLPLLEAMRVHALVIASDPSIPTPLRAGALAFPAGDVEALRALLLHALREPAQLEGVRGKGAAAAAELTWDRTVAATAAVYRELLAA